MATAAETTDIAILKTKAENFEKVLQEIKIGQQMLGAKIDAQTSSYVTREEFNEFKQRWFLSHTLSALFGALLSGLIVYFLTSH